MDWEGCGRPIRGRRVAHRTIRGEAQCDVIGVGCAVKIYGVTASAGVWRIRVVPSGMTKGAIVGDRNVRPRERIDRIVIKSGWRPSRFRVASSAICRELCGQVIRIGRCAIICCVTAVASIGRVVVVPSGMTKGAIVGNRGVCAVQHVIIVVDRECGRLPTGGRRVAHRAIRGDIQRNVVRVGRAVKICGMASRALRRCAGIPCRMTVQTIR